MSDSQGLSQTEIEEFEIEEFVEFLKVTLIPDLHDSGTHATAEDFERAVGYIEYLSNKVYN